MNMGRPKKLSFPCKYCDKIFKRSTYLEKHLLSHHPNTSTQRRNARIRSNWCHACRQSFTQSEYKLHIITEHQYDSHRRYIDNSKIESEEDIDLKMCNNNENFLLNKNIKQEIDKNTSAKSPRQKGLKKLQANPTCSVIKTKSESVHQPLSAIKSLSPKNERKVNPKSQFVICNNCGMKCKNQRGLKVHLRTIHKSNSSSNKDESLRMKVDPEEGEIQRVQSKEVLPEKTHQCKNSVMSSTNNQPLFFQNTPLSQNAQTGLIYNPLPFQTPLNNITGSGNQTNIQYVPIFMNPIPSVETIPKFDYDSENYIKWLKKFIYRCKMSSYPLTPMLCKSISHINTEITEALINPSRSLTKKSNHFYFMKIKSMISEIMFGQVRFATDVIKKDMIVEYFI